MKSLRVHVQGDRYDVEFPVRSPFPNRVPSTRFAPARRPSSVAAVRFPIIVVCSYNCFVPFLEVAAKPFDLIGMYVGVNNSTVAGRFNMIGFCSVGSHASIDRFAYLQGIIDFGIEKLSESIPTDIRTIEFRQEVADNFTPSTAICLICSLTCRRLLSLWRGEVEL